mmetsp:Transcript_15419/g.27889  ORF Transcript_15419/g.27889 Transcript_15419/m.27889 type:complete len:93 (+) Transcript_15419:842-1120(+)
MITSRKLLLQHLTTWIQCENDPSKRETAGRIEPQWQAEYRAFFTGTVGSSFFSIQCFCDYNTRKTEERTWVLKCTRPISFARSNTVEKIVFP